MLGAAVWTTQHVAICNLYFSHLCEWHHPYRVTFVWPDQRERCWCHSVTAGLFHHMKRKTSLSLCEPPLLSSSLSLFVFLHSLVCLFLIRSPLSRLPHTLKKKSRGEKLCWSIWGLLFFLLLSVLRNVIFTKSTVSKEAETSWLKPDNAQGSLKLLQILVLLLWLFVLPLPLGPSRALVYLRSVLRSCQERRAGPQLWPQVDTQLTHIYF